MSIMLLSNLPLVGQEKQDTLLPPPFKLLREDEEYSYMAENTAYKRDGWDFLKFIPFNPSKSLYLSMGGEFRPRYEYIQHAQWGEEADTEKGTYNQRLAMYTNLGLGKHIRLFSELYHGYRSGRNRPEITQDDALDFHQAFVDINIPPNYLSNFDLTLRLGRQQIMHGSSRLIGIREGANIRRSFDAARVIIHYNKTSTEAFFGSEVMALPKRFDNKLNQDMRFWGIFFSVGNLKLKGTTELYYYGFTLNNSTYTNETSRENRQTLGIRRNGKIAHYFYYNTELILQLGAFAKKTIKALAIEFDYHYRNSNWKILKDIGLKFDYASGDRMYSDDHLQTFHPLFYNPSYFGLLSAIAPINLLDVHPSLQIDLSNKLEATIDCDIFWRASLQDGLYSPPRMLVRRGRVSNRFIGYQPGLEINYSFSRHIQMSLQSALFISGSFIKATGPSKNIFYFAHTLTYKF